MSDGRAGMHLQQQFQNPHRPSLDLYQQRHVGSPPSAMMGVASHFNGFNFPYAALPDQAVIMPMSDRADPFSQHQPMPPVMASVPASHSMNVMAAIPGPPFVAEPDPRRVSIEHSDDLVQEKNSPVSNSLEDANVDEFGMCGSRGDGTDLGGKAKDDTLSAPPAWSELKTKAGKDRKRLPLACIACRRKKIRCSGEKPACKHCLRSRIPCVYKVTTRKAAPRTDYMAMLDKRLKRMEERIIKILPKSEQDTTCGIPRAVVKPAIPGTGSLIANKCASRKRNADEAFGADLEVWAKAPRPKMPDDDMAGSPESREDEESQLFCDGIEALPPKEIQEHLAEVFFDNVYGQAYHLLHKPSYMRKLKNDALPPVLILSVCAIAARFTTNPKLNSTTKQFMRGEEWASHARDICTKRYDWPNITILTCLLILGLHEFGTCHGGRAWALGGQAIRMAFALHLHKDLDYDPQARNKQLKLSFIDREIRRRVMWACFLMDRFNSSGTDRPMFIKEETIMIPLPVSERYFQFDMPAQTEYLDGRISARELPEEGQMKEPRENMGVSAYTIRSIAIWGRIITYLNQGGKELDPHPMWSKESEYAELVRDTEEVVRTLPESLQYSRKTLEIHRTENTANHLLFLHMSIQQNLLFLSQAAVAFSQERVGKEAPGDFEAQSSAKTFAAANMISDLLRDAEDLQCNVSTPFAGYCAFSSTAIHITGIFSGNPVMKATAEANSGVNVKFLRKMMKYWGMFHWMVENIRTQYRNALDAARAGGPTYGSTASSPILQYSDWFNRYPRGVSDTDFMDPAMYRKKERGEDGVLEQKPELQSVEEFFTTVGSTHGAENKDGPRVAASKRKTSKKPATTTANKTDQKKTEQPTSDRGGQSVSGQIGAQQQQQQRRQSGESQRRSSGPLGGQTAGPSAFSPLAISQSQNASYSIMSPISPANVPQFSHPTPPQFFSTDMMSMNMGQQSDNMMQTLDRQLSFGSFSMESGSVTGPQDMMNGVGSWDGMSANTNDQVHNRQAIKANGMNGPPLHAQGQLSHDAMNHFSGQDASPGWFVPLESRQDMGLGSNMDAFTGLYGGSSGMTIANHQGRL